MARSTPRGFYVFDLALDKYDHTQVAANWDLADTLLSTPPQSIQTLATVPAAGNFAGRMVMLSAADSGFSAWQLIRFDGAAWRAIGYEILPAIPTVGNFPGRVVVLSATSSPFNAWDIIRYNGTTWDIVGGWGSVNTGVAATNIKGVQVAGDVYINDSARGFVFVDRQTGVKRRLYFSNGVLTQETVT